MASKALQTRFTGQFGLSVPLCLAPMAGVSGGRLAAAWAHSGALALLGGGYGDLAWIKREFCEATHSLSGQVDRLGCGFITWRLEQDCSSFDWLLEQDKKPAAVMLSFGDARRWIRRLTDKNITAVCQIQRIDQLKPALDAGASIIVAQGSEAGGHGMNSAMGRSTFTLLPEIADILANISPDTLLLAAGGISDGRGLAASLILGADGAMLGSRAWATSESLASTKAKQSVMAKTGDNTIRSGIFDILRKKDWPKPYDFRALRNSLHIKWEGREAALLANAIENRSIYEKAVELENYNFAHIPIGECVGLISDIPTSDLLISRIASDAENILSRFN